MKRDSRGDDMFYAEIYEYEFVKKIEKSKILKTDRGKIFVLKEEEEGRVVITDDPWMLLDKKIPKEWKVELLDLWDKNGKREPIRIDTTFSIVKRRINVEELDRIRLFHMAQQLQEWSTSTSTMSNRIKGTTGYETGRALKIIERIYRRGINGSGLDW